MIQKKGTKIKWCFIVNIVSFLTEFLGKLSYQVLEEGDDCVLVTHDKIAEYREKEYFPKNIKILSKVDWCMGSYKKNQKSFGDLSWDKLFPDFDRFNRFKLYNYNYYNSIEMVSQVYQFVDFVLQEEKPDVVVFEMPGGLFSGIFYHFCKKYNIPYLAVGNSRIRERIDVYDSEYTCSNYRKAFEKLNNDNISDKEKEFADDFIRSFLSHAQQSSSMDYKIKLSKTNCLNCLKRYLKREKKMLWSRWQYFLGRRYFKPFDYGSEINLKYGFRYPARALKRRFKILFQKNTFKRLDKNENFFFYPLHSQPEFSTSFLASHFCDQVNTIKNIAFSLPFPYKLYVKEHPVAVGERPGNFYKELKQIPNVVLISPYENVEDLIKKSQGVITLTSTIGMEAALAGKPVYVFGRVFYSYHPSCRKIKSFEELKQKIKEDLTQKPSLENLKDINTRFVLSYFKNTIPGSTINAVEKRDANNYKLIYNQFRKKFLEVN